MHTKTSSGKAKVKNRDFVAKNRLKLWEINPRYHCSIVGTCLSIKELRQIVSKAEVDVHKSAKDYEIHGVFVQLAAKDETATKMMNKKLNQKFYKDIRAFKKLRDSKELSTAWETAYEQGNVPGPYWALLSHPNATIELMEHAFGYVHLLSHTAAISYFENTELIKLLGP